MPPLSLAALPADAPWRIASGCPISRMPHGTKAASLAMPRVGFERRGVVRVPVFERPRCGGHLPAKSVDNLMNGPRSRFAKLPRSQASWIKTASSRHGAKLTGSPCGRSGKLPSWTGSQQRQVAMPTAAPGRPRTTSSVMAGCRGARRSLDPRYLAGDVDSFARILGLMRSMTASHSGRQFEQAH